jgi:hypothetical protein
VNPDQLKAAFEKNKTVVVGGGLAAVVGLALYQKKKAAGSSSTDAGAALSAGSQTAAASGGAAYDSSASDLYGAIQPQLEAIGQQLSALQAAPTTIPVASTPATPTIANDTRLRWVPGTKQITPQTIPRAVRNPAPRLLAATAAVGADPVKSTTRRPVTAAK